MIKNNLPTILQLMNSTEVRDYKLWVKVLFDI